MNKKKKIIKFFGSYKPIIIISLIINILLIVCLYINMNSNKIYSFSGKSDYVDIKDGLIVLNNDINLINGNNIKYIKSIDYEITSFKIGYYVMDDNKLIEIISNNIEINEPINMSEIVNKFTSLNLVEKNKDNTYFTQNKKDLLNKGLYLVIEAKTADEEVIFDKIELNMSRISKN